MVNIPIIFCFDSKLILAASVAIKSLINSAKSDTIYDIKIFHSDISLKKQIAFTNLLKNTNHEICFYYIDPSLFLNLPKREKIWNEVVYYRFLIPQILSGYDKVIYSDVDVYFKTDLSDLYETDLSDYEIAAVKAEKNTPNAICHKYFKENKNEYIYWSGFLIMNCEKMREKHLVNEFFNTALLLKNKLRFFDLDTINIVCNNILAIPINYCLLESFYEYKKLDMSWDYEYLKLVYSEQELINAKNNPAIIHYAGELGKPWHRKYIPNYYKECIKQLPIELRVSTFRDLKKRYFGKLPKKLREGFVNECNNY
jgi:lipopolysaccharide biosynthesis glycosyltransferase